MFSNILSLNILDIRGSVHYLLIPYGKTFGFLNKNNDEVIQSCMHKEAWTSAQ